LSPVIPGSIDCWWEIRMLGRTGGMCPTEADESGEVEGKRGRDRMDRLGIAVIIL
jgi:hypothetical protein